MCLLYTFKFTPRLHFNLLRLETKTKWTSTFSNSQVNELAVSCLLEIHRFVHCFKSSPIISSIGNSRLYSKRVVYKSDQALEMRLLIWARVKVKANFHSVQPNKLWVASVVELPELFCYLSAVNLSGGGLSDGSWRGGECVVLPYGEQRYNEQIHLLAWTQKGNGTKQTNKINKVPMHFMGLGTCQAWLWES